MRYLVKRINAGESITTQAVVTMEAWQKESGQLSRSSHLAKDAIDEVRETMHTKRLTLHEL